MKFSLGFIFILLSACGGLPKHDNRAVDPILEPYVTKIEKMFAFKVSYFIKLDNLNDNLAGVCFLPSNGVTIDKPYFEYYEFIFPLANEALMLHEIGHCSFGLRHDDATFSTNSVVPETLRGCPVSVMTSVTNEGCYSANREYYLNEYASKIGRALIQ